MRCFFFAKTFILPFFLVYLRCMIKFEKGQVMTYVVIAALVGWLVYSNHDQIAEMLKKK